MKINILTTIVLLLAVISCQQDDPSPVQSGPEYRAPEAALVFPYNDYLVDVPALFRVAYRAGSDTLREVKLEVILDSVLFSQAIVPQWGDSIDTMDVSFTFPEALTYTLRASVSDAETTVVTSRSLSAYEMQISMLPDSGAARLQSQLNVRSLQSLTPQVSVEWGDGSDTLFNLPNGYTLHSLPHDYGIGEFVCYAALVNGEDTLLSAEFAITAYNTAPYLIQTPPTLSGNEGDSTSFSIVQLGAYFGDSLTPSEELIYSIVSQQGPAIGRVYAIDDGWGLMNFLRITRMDSLNNGPGSITVQARDPQGLTVEGIVNTQTAAVPTMRIFLTDYNGNPLNAGTIVQVTDGNQNGIQHAYTGPLVLQGTPGAFPLGGFGESYQRTLRPVLTVNDTNLVIPVIPYSILDGIATPEEFYDLDAECRYIYIVPPTGAAYMGTAKMRLDSAANGFQNGGVTIWIEKQTLPDGLPSDTLSDAEQDSIESVILDRHHPYFPQNARAQIHKASWEDSTYFEFGVGPTVQNIITIHKQTGTNPSVAVYDDNHDGTIDRASIFVNEFLDAGAILQELLTAEIAPGNVRNSMPGRTVLQSVWHSPPYIQPADSLLIDIAHKTPVAVRFGDAMYLR